MDTELKSQLSRIARMAESERESHIKTLRELHHQACEVADVQIGSPAAEALRSVIYYGYCVDNALDYLNKSE